MEPAIWDELSASAAAGDADAFMANSARFLDEQVRSLDPSVLARLLQSTGFKRAHALALQDPYTRRGYEKPRGYAGDAVLLDYVYGTTSVPDGTTEFGEAILHWCHHHSAAFKAVNERKGMLAQELSKAAGRVPEARCLAVACGHLRELALVDTAAPTRVLALDQDPRCLAVVSATYGNRVETVHSNIADVVKTGAAHLGCFDLITVAGLYDYLPDPYAMALTERMVEQLNPGGKLLIANFIDCWERGYMECFMGWSLIYRSPEALRKVARSVRADAFGVSTFADSRGVIGYLEITRH